MKKEPVKSFKDWQYEEVENTFGLTRLRTLPFLEEVKKITLPEVDKLHNALFQGIYAAFS